MYISEQTKSHIFCRETIQKCWDSSRILLLISVRRYNQEWTRPTRQNPPKRWGGGRGDEPMCLRRVTSSCLLLHNLCFTQVRYIVHIQITASHISLQGKTVGKQEKFKDIKWVIRNNKLRIGNSQVKRKNRTQ